MNSLHSIYRVVRMALVCLIVMAPGASLHARDEIRFEKAVEGLPSQMEGNMIRDREGFLWFCYYGGLGRYDGREIRYFEAGPDSISGTAPISIVMDGDGVIWILTKDNGLNKYDKETGAFTHYKHDPDDANSIAADLSEGFCSQRLFVDRSNRLLIGTMGGFDIYDKETDAFTHYTHDPDDPNSPSSNNITAIIEDRDGMIWIGTSGSGLNRFDPVAGKWTRYRGDPGDAGSLSGDTVWSLLEDRDGVLWVGTWGAGLNRLDKKTGAFTSYMNDGGDPESIADNRIFSLFEDSHGNIWVTHRDSSIAGLERFDKKTGKFTRFAHDPKNPSSVSSNAVSTVYEDPATGVLWVINALNGVFDKYDKGGRKFMFYQHDPDNPDSIFSPQVLVFLEDRGGRLWASVFGGLDVLDRKTDRFIHYPYKQFAPSFGPIALAMIEDEAGFFWLLDNRGSLMLLDGDGMKAARQFSHDPDNPRSIMVNTAGGRGLIQDRDDPDILWLGMSGGLEKFSKSTGMFTHYIHDPDDPNSITRGVVWSVYDDGKGVLWISTFGGLNTLDKKTGAVTRFTHDPDQPRGIGFNKQSCVFEDSRGNFWVAGFTDGMDKLDRKTGVFTHFNRETGFPAVGINRTIEEDGRGNLWIGATGVGLIKFNLETETVVNVYTKSDGLQGNHFWRSCRSKDGTLWFSGGAGLNGFDPGKVHDNPRTPPVVLTSFTRSGEALDLGVAPEKLEEIAMDWRTNFFEFRFAALDYTRPEKNRYAYMLEGRDREWYYCGANPSGRYTGLAGGNYTLRLKGSNNDGVWNEEGVSIKITVTPPFWKRWWFFTGLALAALSFILAAMVYMVRLTSEISERRKAEKELKESRDDLEKLNRKLRRLDALKDEFMANTSHELRTPLTGIIGLTESLMDGAAGPLTGRLAHNLEMIVASARRLSNLVNDILDFSKLRHKDIWLKTIPLDIHSMAEMVMMMSRTLLVNRELRLINAVPSDAPPVEADENRVQQILFNLVGNAVKFTERGEVVVSARVENDFLAVTVADTGIGIHEVEFERIFESFEQVDGAAGREFGGTGLGLAITRRLVRLHRGEMHVASEVGKGSRFTFTLPLSREEIKPGPVVGSLGGRPDRVRMVETAAASRGEVPPGAVPDVERGGEWTEIAGSRGSILIVDDEPINLQVLFNHLSSCNYRVTRASSGGEALAEIDGGAHFDLVILDVMMPRMTGYEVCRKLRETYAPNDLPVVMLSAKNRVEDLVVGLQSGANDYQVKPFSKSELLARVQTHLRLKEFTDENRRTHEKMTHLKNYLKNIINSMPSILIGVDGDGNVTQWNEEAERFTGVGADKAKGRRCESILPPFREALANVADGMEENAPWIQEKEAVEVNGEIRRFDITVYPLSEKHGKGAVVRIDDVTERSRMEDMMIQTEKMMSLGGLAAGMAHEINNPLAGILQNMTVIRNRVTKDIPRNRRAAEACGLDMERMIAYMKKRDLFRMMDSVIESGRRAAKIVSNMLAFSRKDSSDFAPRAMDKLLDDVVALAENDYGLKKKFDFRNIEIIREYEEELPEVPCVGSKIQQVFLNILRNGAHAMTENRSENRKPRFILRASSEEGMVLVEIEDNGPGMDEIVRKRIFEPFFTTKGVGVGTGLGLSVSYFIITEDHAGEMSVESTPDKGARFIIRLPLEIEQ